WHRIAPIRRETDHLNPAVEVRPGGEEPPIAGEPRSEEAAARVCGDHRRMVLAPPAHQRGDDLGVPARLRPDLQYPRLRPDAEEEQRFLGMPEAVTGAIHGRALT